ncbi:MAG TPA: Holliday junction resolvase RuvX [Vicinamibacterales bacterium]|nr:Holliday junction resolvase RuvX [Vicinamibacterales bacterium]HOQ59619.1 Holliday junction resolvase RuvX [Vicinamibacterales bacterium]HPK72560.1 Holliday junction resolvase RuvX [Vicinamibacterales bacterium]
MRVLGVDDGLRRIGLAVSDPSGTLATPAGSVPGDGDAARAARTVAAAIARLDRGDEPIGAIVVGLPRRLDGSDTEQTARARALADALGRATGLPVHLQDERLSSREAEDRLARRERDWRARKRRLDAAAAAVILQEFLDWNPEARIRNSECRSRKSE